MVDMISVVVSTRKIDDGFINMVKSTSGLSDIQILAYENNGELSLTQVYNKGLRDSLHDIVVFMHDDVIIKTKKWGDKLLKHYNDTEYGILGVAGTKSLGSDGVWWSNRESMYGRVRHTDGNKIWRSEYSYDFGNRIKDVVVVDGVFMSCAKSRIKCSFDEAYDNFHFYDISFCFDNFKSNVSVGVHFNIDIIHKSTGQINDKWENNRLKFINRESKNLPQTSTIDVLYTTPNIILKKEPKLAIIIPTKNRVDDLLQPCVNSIVNNTNYKNYKIYIADTGSEKCELDKIKDMTEKASGKIELINYDFYNFAKINNDMVINKIDVDTELILFCNNDIEMLNDAITYMVNIHQNTKNVGTVGCRLHYENGSIQHLGISLQVNSKNNLSITHKYLNWDDENVRLSKNESYTHGNTAAFMLTSKSLFIKLRGFNEGYVECFEDVEYNLKCLLDKKVNITTSIGACYHFESQTRDRVNEHIDLQLLLKFINANEEIKKTFNKID